MKKSNWKISSLRITAIILIIIGVLFLSVEPVKNLLVKRQTEAIPTVTADDVARNQQVEATFDFKEV